MRYGYFRSYILLRRKGWLGNHTRFGKRSASYLALVKPASAKIWMRFMSQ